MTQENGMWTTCLKGDKAVFHCNIRTPEGNNYIDLEFDTETKTAKITKNYASCQK